MRCESECAEFARTSVFVSLSVLIDPQIEGMWSVKARKSTADRGMIRLYLLGLLDGQTDVEENFGRDARIAAADDGGVGTLPFRQGREDFLLHRRKPRAALDKPFIAGNEPRERLVCRDHR